MGFGAMEATKASEFMGLVAMESATPYALMCLGAMEATKLNDSWAWGHGGHQAL